MVDDTNSNPIPPPAMMPDKSGEWQGGRFQKGVSGNPNGMPPGTRHKSTMLAEKLLQDDIDAKMLGKRNDHIRLAAKEKAPPPIVDFMAAFETNDSVSIKGLSGVTGIIAAIETPGYVPQVPPPPVNNSPFVPPRKSEGKVRAAEEVATPSGLIVWPIAISISAL
jgi:Family of unknown function (DUF5681)